MSKIESIKSELKKHLTKKFPDSEANDIEKHIEVFFESVDEIDEMESKLGDDFSYELKEEIEIFYANIAKTQNSDCNNNKEKNELKLIDELDGEKFMSQHEFGKLIFPRELDDILKECVSLIGYKNSDEKKNLLVEALEKDWNYFLIHDRFPLLNTSIFTPKQIKKLEKQLIYSIHQEEKLLEEKFKQKADNLEKREDVSQKNYAENSGVNLNTSDYIPDEPNLNQIAWLEAKIQKLKKIDHLYFEILSELASKFKIVANEHQLRTICDIYRRTGVIEIKSISKYISGADYCEFMATLAVKFAEVQIEHSSKLKREEMVEILKKVLDRMPEHKKNADSKVSEICRKIFKNPQSFEDFDNIFSEIQFDEIKEKISLLRLDHIQIIKKELKRRKDLLDRIIFTKNLTKKLFKDIEGVKFIFIFESCGSPDIKASKIKLPENVQKEIEHELKFEKTPLQIRIRNLRAELASKAHEKLNSIIRYCRDDASKIKIVNDAVNLIVETNLDSLEDVSHNFDDDDYVNLKGYIKSLPEYIELTGIKSNSEEDSNDLNEGFEKRDLKDLEDYLEPYVDEKFTITMRDKILKEFQSIGIAALINRCDSFPEKGFKEILGRVIMNPKFTFMLKAEEIGYENTSYRFVKQKLIEKIIEDLLPEPKKAIQNLNLDKSTAHRIAKQLVEKGWVALIEFNNPEFLSPNEYRSFADKILCNGHLDSLLDSLEIFRIEDLILVTLRTYLSHIRTEEEARIIAKQILDIGNSPIFENLSELEAKVCKKSIVVEHLVQKELLEIGLKFPKKIIQELVMNGFTKDSLKNLQEIAPDYSTLIKTVLGNKFLQGHLKARKLDAYSYLTKSLCEILELKDFDKDDLLLLIVEFIENGYSCFYETTKYKKKGDEIVSELIKNYCMYEDKTERIDNSGLMDGLSEIWSKFGNYHISDEFYQSIIEYKSPIEEKQESIEDFLEYCVKNFKEDNDSLNLIYYAFLYHAKKNKSWTGISDLLAQLVREHGKPANILNPSTLKYILMTKTDKEVQKKVINSFITCEPLPFAVPEKNKTGGIEMRLIPQIYYILDKSKTFFFSFRVGNGCKDVPFFLNSIFGTTFDPNTECSASLKAINMQADKNFKNPMRNMWVLHAPQPILAGDLQKLARLFNIYCLHISEQELLQFKYQMNKMLDMLAKLNQTVYLLVMNSKLDAKEVVTKYSIQLRPKMKLIVVPDMKDTSKVEFNISKLRDEFNEASECYLKGLEQRKADSIAKETISRQASNADDKKILKNIKKEFLKIIPTEDQKEILKNTTKVRKVFRPIKDLMTILPEKKAMDVLKIYPLYNEYRQMIIKTNDFDSNDQSQIDKDIEKYKKLSQEKESKLQKLKQACNEKAYNSDFLELIQSSNYPLLIDLLQQKLKSWTENATLALRKEFKSINEEYDHLTNKEEDVQKKHKFDYRKIKILEEIDSKLISVDIFKRELIAYCKMCPQDKPVSEILAKHYSSLLQQGFPAEILDGDNYEIPTEFYSLLFDQSLGKKKTLFISITGPQNSGKSTLLNNLFSLAFNTADGRCTKGGYFTIINSIYKGYDQICLIDTEGLLSVEKSDPQYDEKILIFCLAISDIVIINVKDEMSESMKNILASASKLLGLMKKKSINVANPSLIFVYNQKADANINYSESIKLAMNSLSAFKKAIDFGPDSFILLPAAFNISLYQLNEGSKMWRGVHDSDDFLRKVNELQRKIYSLSQKILASGNKRVDNLQDWNLRCNDVFKEINKHKDMTYLIGNKEIEENGKVKRWAKEKLEEIFNFNSGLNPQKSEEMLDQVKFEKNFEELIQKYEEMCITEEVSTRIVDENKIYLEGLVKSQREAAMKRLSLNKFSQSATSELHKCYNNLQNRISKTKAGQKLEEEEANNILDTEIQVLEKKRNELINSEEVKLESNKLIYRVLNDLISLPNPRDFHTKIDEPIEFESKKTIFKTRLANLDQVQKFCTLKIEMFNFKVLESQFEILQENIKLITDFYSGGKPDILKNHYGLQINESKEPITPYNTEIVDPSKILIKLDKDRTISHLKSVFNMKNKKSGNINEDFTFMFLNHIQKSLSSDDHFSAFIDVNRVAEMVEEEIDSAYKSSKRSFDNETAQILSSNINGRVIEKIKNESELFGVRVEDTFLNKINLLIAKKICNYHHISVQNSISESFQTIIKEVQEKKEVIISELKGDASIELKAKAWVNSYKNYVQKIHENKAASFFQELASKNIDKISKQKLVFELDQVIEEEKYKDQLLNYITDNTNMVLKMFEDRWQDFVSRFFEGIKATEKNTITKIEKVKKALEELKNKFTQGEKFIDLYKSSSDIDTQTQEIAAKSFLLNYIRGKSVKNLEVNNQTLTLNFEIENKHYSDLEELEQIIFDHSFSTIPISDYSISEFLTNIIVILGEIDLAHYSKDTSLLNHFPKLEAKKADLEARVKGCTECCPCCLKACDAEHHLVDGIPNGGKGNEHCCKFGHQYRGFGGIYFDKLMEPVLKICEDMLETDKIYVKKLGRKLCWGEAKTTIFTNWNFTPVDEGLRIGLRMKNDRRWNKIGKELCEKTYKAYNIKFVTKNSISKERDPLKFVLMLDASGSMAGQPWKDLMASVSNFLQLRNQEDSMDKITVIIFASNAKTEVDEQPAGSIDIAKIEKAFTSGGTSFERVFQHLIEILKKRKGD